MSENGDELTDLRASSAILKAQESFLTLMGSLTLEHDRNEFLKWVSKNMNRMEDGSIGNNFSEIAEARGKLLAIAADLRTQLPQEAVMPTEEIRPPTVGSDAGMNLQSVRHLDAFLYDEVEEERLVEDGELSKEYCGKCGSNDIRQYTLLTHSCSVLRLEYIFTVLLPPIPADKKILDVGSRLGAVLYGAYTLTQASQIVGVEMNEEFCELASTTVQKHNMDDRISVIHAELSTVPHVLAEADVVILHNVFDWFVPAEVQIMMWQLIRANLKRGALLVTSPAIQQSLKPLPTGIDLAQWLRPLAATRPNMISSEEMEQEGSEVFLYEVISQQ